MRIFPQPTGDKNLTTNTAHNHRKKTFQYFTDVETDVDHGMAENRGLVFDWGPLF